MVWKCKCDCGNKIEIRIDYLQKRSAVSCGCLLHEILSELGKSIDMNKRFGMIENTSVSNIKSKKPSKNSITGQNRSIFLDVGP